MHVIIISTGLQESRVVVDYVGGSTQYEELTQAITFIDCELKIDVRKTSRIHYILFCDMHVVLFT